MKILVMGLPNTGKSSIAKRLQAGLNCSWFNADAIRGMANDWSFDNESRIRQARRMRNLADYEKGCGHTVICDFVCPTEITRYIFEADFTIWCDTIKESGYEDTDSIFETPTNYDIRIKQWTDAEKLYNYLEGGNLGTEDIPSFLNELSKQLDK